MRQVSSFDLRSEDPHLLASKGRPRRDRCKPFARLLFLINIGLVLLFFAGCNLIPKPAKSPTFKGRLLARNLKGQLFEIVADPSTGKTKTSQIVGDVRAAAVSPNKRYLLYSTQSETLLRDLQTGKLKTLFPHSLSDPMWAPDNSKFSYRYTEKEDNCGGLYLSDLSGSSTSIYKTRGSSYMTEGGAFAGLPDIGKPKEVICGALEMGGWIVRDRFIFNRFEGQFPAQIETRHVETDTTTLALLGNTTALVNLPQRWNSVLDSCAEKSFILLEGGGKIFITDTPRDFDSANLRPIGPAGTALETRGTTAIRYGESGRGSAMGFLPERCELYRVMNDWQVAGLKQINFLDPATLNERKGPSLGHIMIFGDLLMDPEGKLIALVEQDSRLKNGPQRITVFDLNTGGSVSLYEATENEFPILLVWLPQ